MDIRSFQVQVTGWDKELPRGQRATQGKPGGRCAAVGVLQLACCSLCATSSLTSDMVVSVRGAGSAPFATVSEEYSDDPGQSDATRVHERPPVPLRKTERFARGKIRPWGRKLLVLGSDV